MYKYIKTDFSIPNSFFKDNDIVDLLSVIMAIFIHKVCLQVFNLQTQSVI